AAVLTCLWGDGSVRFAPTTGNTSQCGGSRVGCQAVIVQGLTKNVEDIDELVEGVCTDKSIKKATGPNASDCMVWRLSANYVRGIYDAAELDYYEPDYIKFVLSLSDEARWAWLEAMIMAEGTSRKHGEIRIAQ